MKKLFLLVVVVLLGFGSLFANPVDVNTAQSLGLKFVQANFEQTRDLGMQLVYTVKSDNGDDCLYVFNVGSNGFIMLSATDNVRPVLAYSEESLFDASNPYNGVNFMLETYKGSISYAIENNIPSTPEVQAQWKSLENCGNLSSKRGSKVGPISALKWNQDSPYNLYAPEIADGPGGRCYAGCVATAMSMVMHVHKEPLKGTGSHSYVSRTHHYNLTVNFADATYDWDNMPNTLGGASQTEIEAVALLMYHCGVAVDMDFGGSADGGSGAYSDDVPSRMSQYFGYGYCSKKSRATYTLANWNSMLKAEFDLGRPVYYSGQSEDGGHAFMCDGYDEDDFMHFNFGWSGSDNGWYAVDAIDFNRNSAAIFNFVPSSVYEGTVKAPENLSVVKTSETSQEANISWKNPVKTMNNQQVSSLDQIVLTRDGVVIATFDNATPGADMSYVDTEVPCFSTFEYKVYAVNGGVKGVSAAASESFGPTCEWKIVATSNNMSGWKGGRVVAYDGAGRELASVTMTSNNPTSFPVDVTLGRVWFEWKQSSDEITSMSFKIKDASGSTVYEYSGSTNDIPSGVLYSGNNGCGNNTQCDTPSDLYATQDGDNIVLSWTGVANPAYGYNIYRDGVLFKLSSSNEFVDEAPAVGGHCYQVCVLCDGGESAFSNEACANAGEGCESGSNLWYELQSNMKPIITWNAPANTEGLSGYYVYRKVNDGEYERIKIVAANKTEYKETKTLEYDNWYTYKVMAYYQDIDCFAAPIKAMYGNQYCVSVYYSVDGVDETASNNVSIYPNPAKDVLSINADNLSSIMIYNSIGQKVLDMVVDTNETTLDITNLESGIYFVRLMADGREVTQKVSIVR